MGAGAASDISALKQLAAGIVKSQGNRFIKDLLRSKGVRIGTNKDEFQANLDAAIESGQLTFEDVTRWLNSVEGWGNQHVYFYRLSPALRKQLTEEKIRQQVVSAKLGELWNKDTTLEFPERPTLTSISFSDSIFRITWHESALGWVRVPEKDVGPQQEGLDTYKYLAYRLVESRTVTRFEARVKLGLAALFITDPIDSDEHKNAIVEAKRVIGLLSDLTALENGEMDIGSISRNLDQRNVPTNKGNVPVIKTQRSRLAAGGSYVEFAANSATKAYWEEQAIQNVRKSVKNEQLGSFYGAEGVFAFQPVEGGLARALRVQLYSKDNRIRLWAQMEAAEVWEILTQLSTYI